MNRKLLDIYLLAALLSIAVPCMVLAQGGSLTPPGAPAPTMVTLETIHNTNVAAHAAGQAAYTTIMTDVADNEPRTPITSLPFVITEIGSYYLTTNLTTTGHGIVIQTNDVIVDLMGFTLSGDSGVADYGIHVDGGTVTRYRVVVRNGILRQFGRGLYLHSSCDSLISGMHIANTTSYGIYAHGGGICSGNTFRDCKLFDIGGDGISLYSTGAGGQCNGNRVVNCSVRGTTGVSDYGILLTGDNGAQCNGNTVENCSVTECVGSGIRLDGSFSGECEGNIVRNCVISSNGGYGIFLYHADYNVIERCVISGNMATRAIFFSSADYNRFEANQMSGDSNYGIYSTGIRNMIVKNSAYGFTNNYFSLGTDVYGPIVTDVGALPSTGSAVHPWANFSY